MILYKYVPDPNLFLKERYIRASQLSSFNDPFEAYYCQQGLKELLNDIHGQEYSSELMLEIDSEQYKFGAICLSESRDNILMWAHYANNHKGAAIGILASNIDGSSLIKNTIPASEVSTSMLCELDPVTPDPVPVIYRSQPRYRNDTFDREYSNASIEHTDRIVFEIFQQKSDHWIYEKEHRIVVRLIQSDRVIIPTQAIQKSTLRTQIKAYLKEKSQHKEVQGKPHREFRLDEIEDLSERHYLASILLSFSKNPDAIYLFKVENRNRISGLSLGLSWDSDTSDLHLNDTPAFFKLDKAEKNRDYYAIEFISF